MDEDGGEATVLTDRALLPLVDASALDHAVRLAVGVSGQSDVMRYGRAVGRRGRWAVLALSGVAFACALPALLVLLLGPVVSQELGSTEAHAQWGLVVADGIVAVAALLAVIVTRVGRRHGVAVAAAVNAGVVAVVISRLDPLAVTVVLLGVGAGLASIGLVVLRPLVVDVAPPEVRVRALARWRGATVLGAAAAAALAALAIGGPTWGWRTALMAAGIVAVVLGLVAVLVDDPGVGGFERRRLAKLGPDAAAPEVPEEAEEAERVRGSMRRVARRPVVLAALLGYLGVGLAGLASIRATAAVVQSLGLTAPDTYGGLAVAWAAAAVAVWALARLLERLRRHSPSRLAAAAPVLLLVAAGGLTGVGWSPSAAGALVATAVVAAGATLAAATLDCTVLSAVRPPDRPAASALTAAAVALGAMLGQVWFAVPVHHDITGSLVAWLAAPVAVLAVLLAGLPRAAERALDELVGEIAAGTGGPAAAAPSPEHDGEPDDGEYGGRHRAGVEGPDEPPATTDAPAPTDLPTPSDNGSSATSAAGVELTVRLVPTATPRGAGADGLTVPAPREIGRSSVPAGDRPDLHGVSVLDAQAVSVAYGSLQVVVDVDLRLQAGETVALIGPSGVGRAALLRVMAGEGQPSSGTVLLDGEDVAVPPAFPRAPLDLAEIVRGRPLLGSMTVAENLRMYGFTVGHDKAEVDARTAVAYDVYPQLGDRREQLAATLSGADRQRVALARSLVAAPHVLLVEPESLWLRPVVAAELSTVLSRLRADGTGLLLVAESSEDLPLPVDRAYLLARGRVVEQGVPPPA